MGLELLMVISALLMPSCDSRCADSYETKSVIYGAGHSGLGETDETLCVGEVRQMQLRRRVNASSAWSYVTQPPRPTAAS